MKNKTLKRLSFVILSLIIVGLVFMASFFMSSYSPNSMAMDNLENSQLVDVNVDDFITFTPENVTATTGLIIYPGAKVEAEAYAPLANKIAQVIY